MGTITQMTNEESFQGANVIDPHIWMGFEVSSVRNRICKPNITFQMAWHLGRM